MPSSYRLAVDVGGTFTDFALLNEGSGEIHIAKSLTTPDDPSVGVLTGITAFNQAVAGHVESTKRIAHATTLVANAVIERKGALTALLTTAGFRDVLELRRHVRVTTYELWADPPEPLVPRWLRLPVNERVFSDGTILKEVESSHIAEVAKVLRNEGVTSVAVSFLHSYANAENERKVVELLETLVPNIAVTRSSEVLPQIKEYERTSTTVVNAYVKPLTQRYLTNLERGLVESGYNAPLNIMLSNGGLGSSKPAADFPIRLIEAGPVAGAIVGRELATLLGLSEVLSFDMGGTTAKACLIRNQTLPITDELEVARSKRFTKSSGFPVGVPAANMIEIGAGGGSIARVNQMGVVQVGPESAGADPGPICYGHGGLGATVTDADLVLGYLNPDHFAGGSIALDLAEASAGITEQIAGKQGRTLVEAAWTIHDVINETMATAVRMHVTERGGNPDTATMVAFGGAGPVHACNLARKLRMERFIIPLRAGVLSALGLLIAPPAYDIVKTFKSPLDTLDWKDVLSRMKKMEEEIGFSLDGIDTVGKRSYWREVDVGYIGQSYQVTVGIEDQFDGAMLQQHFAALYREKYGYFYADVPAEIVNLRVRGEIVQMGFRLKPLETPDAGAVAPSSGVREAYSASERRMMPHQVYQRTMLVPGMRLIGPAIVEEATSTTVIDQGWTLDVDSFGSLSVRRTGVTDR